MELPRRKFLHLVSGAALVPIVSRTGCAQSYPTRPVHIVAPYPPGAGPDVVARLIAQWLSDRLGQQLVVDNRPGAAGNIGTEKAAKSPPDGYTVLMTVSTNAINQTLYSNLNFDFRNDLVPIVGIGRVPFIVVSNPNFPVKTVTDLIAYAKANPGRVDVATNGVGTGSHAAAELLMMRESSSRTYRTRVAT